MEYFDRNKILPDNGKETLQVYLIQNNLYLTYKKREESIIECNKNGKLFPQM